jgi:ubiquinone/menaquinone biosynthesis C-methylase UbiE
MQLKTEVFEQALKEHLHLLGLEEHPLYDMMYTHQVNWVSRLDSALSNIEPFLPYPWSQCKALDIGCGIGTASVMLARRGCLLTVGIDLSRHFMGLGMARKLNAICGCKACFNQSDAASLPFASRSFDLCFCDWVVEHVNHTDQLLQEAYRVLHPNGILYLSTNNRLYPIEPHSQLWGVNYLPQKLAARYVAWRGRAILDYTWDVHAFVPPILKSMVRKSGFEIVSSWNSLSYISVIPTRISDLLAKCVYIVAQR